jgi:hypothetical protein
MNEFKEAAARRVEINFHCKQISGYYLEGVNNLAIGASSVVTNIASTPVVVEGDPIKTIASQKSAILRNAIIISADNIIVTEVKERANLGNVILQDGWESGYELYGDSLKEAPLWRSPVEEVGTISLDPYQVTSTEGEGEKINFTIKVNLWYATEKGDCIIHNTHDFIEFHSQLVGVGRMQKFKTDDKCSLYEEQILAEGNTHEIFCEATDLTSYKYPWHQYYSDTDCIWMVVELHPD